jgi:hypothetical protein
MLDMAAAELQKIKGFCDRFLVLHTQEYERLKIEVQKIEFATVTELTRYCEIAMKASTSLSKDKVSDEKPTRGRCPLGAWLAPSTYC